MALELRRFAKAREFRDRAEPFLLAHEAEHNLLLGIVSTLVRQPARFDDGPPYLATIERGGDVAAVALRTPPQRVILSLVLPTDLAAGVLDLLTRDLHAAYRRLPGVLGPSDLSRAFAERWQTTSGQPYRPGMRQRIYQLESVIPVTGVPGTLRRATEDDRTLLRGWCLAFAQETGEDLGDPDRWVTNRLMARVGGAYLWEDGQPVSLVGYGGPTPNGIRIGPVYTPPACRRRGYASAAVAAVSQLLLDGGRHFCFLFTDLANPTSNHIYQVIGYRPVCDVDVYTFG